MNDQSNIPQPADPLTDMPQAAPADMNAQGKGWGRLWENLVRLGLGEVALRVGTGLASLTLILLVVWVMGNFYLKGKANTSPQESAQAAVLSTATAEPSAPQLAQLAEVAQSQTGISRQAQLHTILPDRPRFEVTTYEVQKGDTLFSIAERFTLKPETLLFGNYDALRDNPHSLRPGQKLNILPVDGTYHKWSAGENLNTVAKYYGVKVDDVISYPGNHLDANTVGDLTKPNIEPGTMLIVPGGKRSFVSWSVPIVSRKNPAAAKVIGPGYCGEVKDGPVGTGSFIWPGTQKFLSGTDYLPQANHPAIDIAAGMGTAIYAVDSGVVVYSGWNDWGYGNLLIIDHGNGWQSIYGHLSQLNVGCGAGVKQGQVVALAGSTGNSTGPHLHFELQSEIYGKVNPKQFLIK
jgi:murein DD-endopeptidase MepM/ murein hydrolase activator NlpD